MQSHHVRPRPTLDRVFVNLAVDAAFMLAFLVAIEVNATGIAFHEWWGLGLTLFICVHVLLHWRWVAMATQRFWRNLRAEPRLNALVDAGLYLGFVTMIFSGVVMSRSVLPALGLRGSTAPFWLALHIQSTNLTLLLVTVHLAAHWRWLVAVTNRYVLAVIRRLAGTKKPVTDRALGESVAK
jgi:hypothetical protein